MNALTPGQSRILALVLLILLVLVLVQLLLVPLWGSWRDQGERLEALQSRLEVYDRLIDGMAQDRQQLAHLQASQPVTDWYLNEATPALAAASLQQLLLREVNRTGAQVVSTQILTGSREAPLPAVSIQAHLRGELSDLVDLLYSLESARPVLFVDNLAVLANPRRQPASSRSYRRGVPALDIRFDLTGYARREATP